jgi:hypothetical protein
MMLTVADGYGAGPGIMGEMMARDLVGRPGCERFPNDGLARISVGQ